MQTPERQIFRESALKHYRENREKDALLRILPLPTIVFLWALIGFLLAAGLFVWNERIPTYVSATGVVRTDKGNDSVAIVFLPPEQVTTLRDGQSAQVQIGSAGPQVQGKIIEIEQGMISPDTARQDYALAGKSLVTQPSVIVIIQLGPTVPPRIYAGSSLSVEIEAGSQRILSLLPWIGKLLGE